MPYRPENELKRPDLKGEFLCGHCGKTFCHAASLNRHRLNFHGDDQMCMICHQKILQNDTVRRHMQSEHNIQRVFTCGCCNWTFPDKKELHNHNQSMASTGTPGAAAAIAVSGRKPGSLSQHELRGEERTPRGKKRSQKSTSPVNPPADAMFNILSELIKTANPLQQNPVDEVMMTPPQAHVPASWVNQLLISNPGLAMLFQPSTSSASSTSSSETEIPKTPEPIVMAPFGMNNNAGEPSTSTFEDALSGAEEENIDDGKDDLVKAVGASFLSIKTEQPTSSSLSSGPESGIGSAPTSHTPSPVSNSPVSSDVSPTSASDLIAHMVQKAKRSKKRHSIDDICLNLSNKRIARA
ncbi:unnamed protein product [Caenorhabditis brenneri]